MKMFIRDALLGAAGLVALSLPAHAVGSATVASVSWLGLVVSGLLAIWGFIQLSG
jgi:hypothetical protein